MISNAISSSTHELCVEDQETEPTEGHGGLGGGGGNEVENEAETFLKFFEGLEAGQHILIN